MVTVVTNKCSTKQTNVPLNCVTFTAKIHVEMDSYHLATYDEDDLYSGFNDVHPTLNPSTLILDPLDAQPLQTSLLQVK